MELNSENITIKGNEIWVNGMEGKVYVGCLLADETSALLKGVFSVSPDLTGEVYIEPETIDLRRKESIISRANVLVGQLPIASEVRGSKYKLNYTIGSSDVEITYNGPDEICEVHRDGDLFIQSAPVNCKLLVANIMHLTDGGVGG